MTVKEALKEGIMILNKAGLTRSAALDAEVLLGDAARLTREKLFTSGGLELTTAVLRRYRSYLKRRLTKEPVAYIVGHKEFFGLDFRVKKDKCLIPRPETEVLVERAIEIAGEWRACHVARERRGEESGEWDDSVITPPLMGGAGGGCYRRPPHLTSPTVGRGTGTTIVDVGTGSGAIAVAVAKTISKYENLKPVSAHSPLPTLHSPTITATDLSPVALKLAKANAEANGVSKLIRFVKCDLLPKDLPRDGRLLVLANLPYVSTAEWRKLDPGVRDFEPRLALDGGQDGLDAYRKLFAVLKKTRPRGGFVLLAEIHPEQYGTMTRLVRRRWPKAKTRRHLDLAKKTRIIEIDT